jgi:DeoR family transcriptional regulator, fructose operon transcriptional repressor
MVDNATEVILVADHSKFGRVTLGRVCGLERLDAIVTDEGLPGRFVAAFATRGLRVHVAGAAPSSAAALARTRRR